MRDDIERLLGDVPAAFPRPGRAATRAARKHALAPHRSSTRRPRRLSLIAAAAVCVAATLGFTAGHWLVPAEGAAATAVSVAATQDALTVGDTFTIYGTLASGRAHEDVAIDAKECGVPSAFHLVGGATTVSGGAFGSELSQYPERTTTYRARWHGGTSTPITVYVRPRLDVQYTDGILRVQVWAGAIVDRKRAILEEFDRHGAPRTLRTFVIRNAGYGTGGDANVRVRLPRHRTIRVVLPQIGPCFADGISPPVAT